jgi:hypothetical protein
MFACTLKTKPVDRGSSGEISVRRPLRLGGSGPYSPMPSINSFTPKELIADPNQIGVIDPFRNEAAVEGGQQFARHFNLFAELLQQVRGHVFGQFRVVQPADRTDSATRLRSARSMISSRSCSMS